MCGILGAFSDREISGEDFEKALEKMESRGPDDEGYLDLETGTEYTGDDSLEGLEFDRVSSASSTAFFGNRRLSITGGERCRLPVRYKHLSMVYEGEIYNYEDIRETLEERDHKFETDGDSEVLIHAFEEWGVECFSRLEGKWSIGIHDSEKEELYLFRDYFGTKPLYYFHSGKELFFSSLISPLLQLKPGEPEEDTRTSADYLLNNMVDHSRRTFFQDIKQLRPREYLKFDGEDVTIEELPGKEVSNPGSLEQAVSEDLESRIPERDFTVTLSGGLDSSIVACELSEELSKSYSLDIDRGKYEPPEHRETVVEETGIDSEVVETSVREMLERTADMMEIQEEPVTMLPAQAQYVLFEKISREDSKVIITGSGADEMFLGYPNFIYPAVIDSFRREGLLPGMKMLLQQSRKGRIDPMHLLSVLMESSPKEWLKEKLSMTRDSLLELPEEYSPEDRLEPKELSRARDYHLETYWYPAIMRMTDKNAGAFGLETREGFLSGRIQERSVQQDPLDNFREGSTKKTLRDAFRDTLPEEVVNRDDKVGFLPTDGTAYSPEIRQMFLDTFRSDSFKSRELLDQEKIVERLEKNRLDFRFAYRLYCYEIWSRKFIDGD